MVLNSFGKFLVKTFGSRNERMIKNYMTRALEAGEFEDQAKALSDDQIREKTAEFKQRLSDNQKPEQILPEAFAVVREAARRNVEMRHYDVQLIGGNVLFEGKIAEMATGEGKTLVATLAAYLVHLTGKKVHIITVNDYLAKRDAEWMRPVYEALGLTVGAIQADMDTRGAERKHQYACDITYGTNNEFGFDYLRDNMKTDLAHMAQGPLDYTIIDEVDSILIDEARTPLIISGPAFDDVSRYKKADIVARQLIEHQRPYDSTQNEIDRCQRAIANAQGELNDAKRAKDPGRQDKAQKAIDENEEKLARAEQKLETCIQFYEVEIDRKSVHLTHEGIGKAQEIAGIGSFFTGSNMEWPHMLEQSLRAHVTFEREKEYVVLEGKVVIVDEFTGRLMHGRQWSDGLHQAVEAKENVQIKEETQTLATITLQNFFKLYGQLAGMTGTAATESEEFMNIYSLEVVVIPTNRPCVRDDMDDVIYKSIPEKFNAIVEDIHDVSSQGRPVLVGTISIEKSEAISNALKRKYGLEHEVLNAKQHEREASIVEKAGHQYQARNGNTYGNVTIATNMAGRGTDIKLGPGVAEIGGLHIVGTERHESRRIDNQLRGRAGRQGDKGSSVFFLSFDDDLLRNFAPEWTIKALTFIGWEEGQPISHSRISKGIEKAQQKVEERNFEARKSLLEYDEVMDYQRKVFYSRRRTILKGEELKDTIMDMTRSAIHIACETMLNADYPYRCIGEWARSQFGLDLQPNRLKGLEIDEIETMILDQAAKDAENEISITIGEYLQDFENPASWNLDALSKWAMSTYSADVSVSKMRKMDHEEILQMVTETAVEQVRKKDTARVNEFLKEEYPLRTLTSWAVNKFDIELDRDALAEMKKDDIEAKLIEAVEQKYAKREVEYPVEFALNITFGPEGPSMEGFTALSKWAKDKFNLELDPQVLPDTKPQQIHETLLEASRNWHDSGLEQYISSHTAGKTADETIEWANQRYRLTLDPEQYPDEPSANEAALEAARAFTRRELSDLEKYVLLQIYDLTWKDHLYAMDHLKESVFLRAFAEKDPKLEYKQEGYRMFNEMLDQVEDKVTDTIFKVRLDRRQPQQRDVWSKSKTQHDQVSQFEMAQRQRAAATAPQGERKVKQIVVETPKVGRNDPCPCGSGKKYKKCCGKNT